MSEFDAAFESWVSEGLEAQQEFLSKSECLSFEALSTLTHLSSAELAHLESCSWCLGVRERFTILAASVSVESADENSLKLQGSPGSRRLSLVDAESGARVLRLDIDIDSEPEPGTIRLRQALDSETLEKLKTQQYRVSFD